MSGTAETLRRDRTERYREEERESLQKQGDLRQLKRLMKYLRPRRKQVLLAVLVTTSIGALSLLPLVLIKHAIDAYILPGKMGGVIVIAGALVLVQAISFALERWSQILIARIGQQSMRDMRLEIFDHIQSQSLRFFDRNPVGRLITRLTSDVNALNELFSQGIVGIFQEFLQLFFILGLLLYYNWYLTLWTLPVIPLILVASNHFRSNVFIFYRLMRVRLSRMNSFVQENVTGMRTVQANTREGRQFEIFDQLNGEHRDSQVNIVFHYALFFPLVEMATSLGFALVLWGGGQMLLGGTGTVSVGELALFVTALDRFFEPIKDLSEKYNVVQSAIAAGERLFTLLDTKPTIVDPAVPKASGPLQHTIEFRDVWFAYNEEEWVLKGVSFTMNKGETFAIVGPTGSGKTTLMSLLCRFYDIQKGAILIDGVDIREMRQADLREKIAIVMQDVFLFFGSVSENIRLGNSEITQEKVVEVSKETGFDEFVERFPRGYETGVRERGATLSTGQKQLLSFARALAFDPQILILDEATANVDTESEEQLQRAVARLCAGRTSLVIAHRLSTIQRANCILVLHHGHLAEQGSHEELLAKDGLYRKLYELQYKDQNPGSADLHVAR